MLDELLQVFPADYTAFLAAIGALQLDPLLAEAGADEGAFAGRVSAIGTEERVRWSRRPADGRVGFGLTSPSSVGTEPGSKPSSRWRA